MHLQQISGNLFSDEFGRLWKRVSENHYEMVCNPNVDNKRQLSPDNIRGYYQYPLILVT